ncbi:MAG: polysaccharide deacetylase family protein [Bacteroidia bacterium]
MNTTDSRPWLAMTFDDGFVNNLNFALPIIEKYEAPTTIFVLSAPLQNEKFVNWADLIDVLVRRKDAKSIKFLGDSYELRLGRFVSTADEARTLVDAIKDAGPERCAELDSMMAMLWQDRQLSRDYEGHFRLMNREELRKCSSSPFIEIGSHSKLHYNLGRMTDEVAKRDLLESKSELENALQVPIDSIAYPDGDYTEITKNIAETLGYSRQLAVTFRLPSDQNDNRIRRRFSYSNSTTHESNMLRMGMQWASNYTK